MQSQMMIKTRMHMKAGKMLLISCSRILTK